MIIVVIAGSKQCEHVRESVGLVSTTYAVFFN